MKKIISLILALMLFMSMATVSFATGDQTSTEPGNEQEGGENENTSETGTITIHGVSVKKEDVNDPESDYVPVSTYTAYKMLILESYNAKEGRYNYKVAPGWDAFFSDEQVKTYFNTNEHGYVDWNKITGEYITVRAAEVSKLALEYVKEKNSDEDETNNILGITGFNVSGDVVNDIDAGLTLAPIQLSGLGLGYYLVDSNAGALCGLTTTKPHASFNAKNVPPSVKKLVKEDSILSGTPWREENDASVGEVVEFDATITVRSGAENYVLHEKMDKGLTFINVERVYHEGHDMKEDNYEIIVNKDDNGNIIPLEDGCTFEIKFVGDFYKDVVVGDSVVVLYKAKLNENAVYFNNSGNRNEVWLTYGEGSSTASDTTITKTYGFDLAKTTTDGKLLNGAEFQVYSVATGGAPIKFILDNANNEDQSYGHIIYRVATDEETAIETITVTEGYVRIIGLDSGHYYLQETKAPESYNLLSGRKEIYLNGNNFLQFDDDGEPLTNAGVHVINQAGTILPETGAAGTTMFIALGSVVVIATGLLLVTKKRMSMIK